MKLSRLTDVLIAMALGFCAISMSCTAQETLSEQTRKNLNSAMHGEAFEYLSYLHFAQWAKLSGYPELAQTLEAVANSEGNDHFVREAAAYGLVRSNETNLTDAIKSEMAEQIGTYVKFADEAQKAGDTRVAAMFREIANDEKHHFEMLQKGLDQLKGEQAGNRSNPAAGQ